MMLKYSSIHLFAFWWSICNPIIAISLHMHSMSSEEIREISPIPINFLIQKCITFSLNILFLNNSPIKLIFPNTREFLLKDSSSSNSGEESVTRGGLFSNSDWHLFKRISLKSFPFASEEEESNFPS
jgi:hypothetical protein